jgi:hypothetical protein
MGPLHPSVPSAPLGPLGWPDINARRAETGSDWPTLCPLCSRPFGEVDDDLRWLAEHGRLVRLPDGCAAHRYCAIENPKRNPALIVEHDCDPAGDGA